MHNCAQNIVLWCAQNIAVHECAQNIALHKCAQNIALHECLKTLHYIIVLKTLHYMSVLKTLQCMSALKPRGMESSKDEGLPYTLSVRGMILLSMVKGSDFHTNDP